MSYRHYKESKKAYLTLYDDAHYTHLRQCHMVNFALKPARSKRAGKKFSETSLAMQLDGWISQGHSSALWENYYVTLVQQKAQAI